MSKLKEPWMNDLPININNKGEIDLYNDLVNGYENGHNYDYDGFKERNKQYMTDEEKEVLTREKFYLIWNWIKKKNQSGQEFYNID